MKTMTMTMTMLLLATAALSACSASDDPPAPPTEQDYDEVSRAMSTVLQRQLSPADGMTRTSSDIALGRAPSWLAQASGGLWLGTLFGLHFQVDVGCEDSAGARVACGASASSASGDVTADGHLSLFGWTGSYKVSASGRLAGLHTPTLTASTTGQIELESQFVEWFRPVTHDTHFSITASSSLEIDTATAVAVSGSAHYDIDYTRTRSDTGEVAHHELVVDASIANGFATFELGGITYRIELRTGKLDEI